MNTIELQNKIVELQLEVQRLRGIADRDQLTGCLRREAFLSMIEEQRRFGWLPMEATLVVVDIDHFKKVNDTHGHLAGDEALRVVAATLRQHLPSGGLACRMGGEEFVLVLPGTARETQAQLEALRAHIAETPIQLPTGRTIRVTASFGAADWQTDKDLLAATARADAALYHAKREGRNRVSLHTETSLMKIA